MTLFPFVQLEFTHAVGPDAGRYLVELPEDERRDDAQDGRPRGAVGLAAEIGGQTRAMASADVLAIAVAGGPAAKQRFGLRRTAHSATPGETPREVALQLVTFVRATRPFADGRAARAALAALKGDETAQGTQIADALAVLNRAVRAHRAAAGDPYITEVTREDARAIRLGFGSAEELYGGSWEDAFVPAPLSPERLSRIQRLGPTEVVAGVLAGRAHVLEGEDVLLRAMLDHRQGRPRAAALLAAVGLELLAAELDDEQAKRAEAGDIEAGEEDGGSLGELRASAAEAAALAATAREQPLDDDATAAIERVALVGLAAAHAWRSAVI